MFAYLFLRFLVFFFRYLPFWVVHQISIILCFLSFYLFRLRRKQIEKSLSHAFPDKNKKERALLSWKIYLNTCDVLCETLKSYSLCQDLLQKRVKVYGLEALEKLSVQKKSCVIYFSHMCNWEWLVILGSRFPIKPVDVYKRIHNKRVDRYVLEKRSLSGAELVDQSQFQRYFKNLLRKNFQNKLPRAFIFISDHRPRASQESLELRFLRRKAKFVLGPEKIARKFDLETYYLKMSRVKRGFYRIDLLPLGNINPDKPIGFQTKKYVNMLEKDLKKRPSDWFWFHNRWKN